MQISLATIPKAVEVRSGLPRVDWLTIGDWVDDRVPENELNDVMTQLAREWIDLMIESLPPGYTRTESNEFLLLSRDESPSPETVLDWCEFARQTILAQLGDVASVEGYGKHLVMTFADRSTYYDYICDWYPEEGEFGLTGGMFVDCGYGHIVMCMANIREFERTIAHELTHTVLRHLPLPLWLDEAVTQIVEDVVLGNSYFRVARDTVLMHRNYWNGETIDSFWSGESFSFADAGQGLSYQLAEILFRNLMSDYPKQIVPFLKLANYADAGDAALRDTCGVSLSDRVAQFLGSGPWAPRTDYGESTSEAGP